MFRPYSKNGGSVVAIAGDDYAIIGADTRLSSEVSVLSRCQTKLRQLTARAVVGVAGCSADAITFTKLLDLRTRMYKFDHNITISTPALAHMLSTMMYFKRFFPYYVLTVIAGIEQEGKGCVFRYDPIGHMEQCTYTAVGSAGSQLQPLLDNQIGKSNMKNVVAKPLSQAEAMALLKDGFTCAAERDIYTGDCVDILTITADEIRKTKFKLRRD